MEEWRIRNYFKVWETYFQLRADVAEVMRNTQAEIDRQRHELDRKYQDMIYEALGIGF